MNLHSSFSLPDEVIHLLSRLRQAGYEAFAVGGCVRDSLMGRVPHDWDLCTSATPDQMKAVFAGEHLVETGLLHGTLTVVLNHHPYEVTTFRVEGGYADHRHPDRVDFVTDVREDLSRRDFTVNAMAFSPETGLVDAFGGVEDLRRGLLRCVGLPDERFREDALRILRALRFASVFDFEIEAETDRALRALAPSLRSISAERIREELLKLLCGAGAGRILRTYPEVLAQVVPPIGPMIGYDQNNHHHHYTLWEHTVQAVENVPPEPDLRLTMLLHDTGKPQTRTTDERGESHYIGHQAASADIAARVADALRLDRASQDRIVRLVAHHDIPLRNEQGKPNTDRAFLLRRLNQFGEEDLRALFRIHRADRIATGYSSREKEDARLAERMAALDSLLAEKPCFSLRDLAINGRDLTALGLRGEAVGRALNAALDAVMQGTVPNEREPLLEHVRSGLEKF